MQLTPGLITRLRAFEAVGRHLSFNQAAVELQVTPTALSHHVRGLERELGVELFTRRHRRIELTPAGQLALDDCTGGLQLLARAAERAAGRNAETLVVSVAPYFSAKWLIPRLGTFWAAHPTIPVQLHHAYEPANFLRDDIGLGISWGDGHWPRTDAVQLVRGHLTPVCSKEFRRRLPARPSGADLVGQPLFYEFSAEHWVRWFAEAGVDAPPPTTMTRIDDSHALLNLALNGEGVALFFADLVRDDLRTGQLQQPVRREVDPGSAYYLTQPSDAIAGPQLQLFREWVLDEAELDRVVVTSGGIDSRPPTRRGSS